MGKLGIGPVEAKMSRSEMEVFPLKTVTMFNLTFSLRFPGNAGYSELVLNKTRKSTDN